MKYPCMHENGREPVQHKQGGICKNITLARLKTLSPYAICMKYLSQAALFLLLLPVNFLVGVTVNNTACVPPSAPAA